MKQRRFMLKTPFLNVTLTNCLPPLKSQHKHRGLFFSTTLINGVCVIVVHATFLSSGYLLTATGPQALFDDALSHPSTEEVSVENWTRICLCLCQSKKVSNKVLVKCLVMNEKLLIDALKEGSSDPAHLEICVRDYTIANESSNYSEQSAVGKTRTEKRREEKTERCGLQNWRLGF
ncbi:probable proteasome inhibitor [Arachis ipaensis]|uniref:PI31 proteasome regulator N-terminal domain-containing protein n=1 Tax=Arachis hypogaea TaxID=3818 RepID=A0A445AG40_ARAHY|nr:probable proteasome inhibitor [Arachis ipaensis]QHO23604.1 putative proteasome inhibitor [Arachis hypogaea]RYR25406.1 hypothetical protein Ahy_B02g059127 [Arachis hypogaea]